MDIKKLVNYLITFLLVIGILAYIYGVWEACRLSWSKEGAKVINPFLSSVVSSIAALLATNLGAVLGISASVPKSEFRALKTWNPFTRSGLQGITIIQVIACYIYILSLLAAAVVWTHTGFETDNDKIVSLIPEMTKSLVGVIIGVMAISLNIQPPKPITPPVS